MTTVPEYERLILGCLSGMVDAKYAQSIDPQAPFFDYGIDSVEAVTFIARLSDLLGIYLPAEIVFDYPTPRELAEFLANSASLTIPEGGQLE
jgi:acyl carrier protein